MVDNCLGCEVVHRIDEHWEAIFDFLDAEGISYGDLVLERIRIHNEAKRP